MANVMPESATSSATRTLRPARSTSDGGAVLYPEGIAKRTAYWKTAAGDGQDEVGAVPVGGDLDCELPASHAEAFPREHFEFVVSCGRNDPFSEGSVAPGRAKSCAN